MADLSDVRDTLVALAATACYPDGILSPSITTRQITIGSGWPEPLDVDAAMSAGNSIVTVYAMPGATAKEPPVYEPPQIIVAPVIGMVATVAEPAIATITGTPAVNEYLTFIVDGFNAYTTTASTGATNATMATAMAALVAADFPGTAAVAGVVTVVGAHALIVRIGAPYITGQLLHRQRQQFRVTVFSPTDTDRTAIAAPIDVMFKENIRLTFSDTSQGIMIFLNVLEDDTSQKLGNYRRGLVYDVCYGTINRVNAYLITSVSVQSHDIITDIGTTIYH